MWYRMWEAWLSWCKKWRARWSGSGNRAEIREIRKLLEQRLQEKQVQEAETYDPSRLSGADREIYDRILSETRKANRNNVTRTAAYLELYSHCPELHWAFLAHMVSRNGGYNMTDLQGELVSRSMEPGDSERFFHFLERANYLIFGDAYPQLLLYEASRDQGRSLFHLLPYFGVSKFMQVIWARFWETRNSELLTIALVVNEQNYIDQRVVKNPKYQQVVHSFEFQAQTFLNLSQVVFPFWAKEKGMAERIYAVREEKGPFLNGKLGKANSKRKGQSVNSLLPLRSMKNDKSTTKVQLAGVVVDTFLSLEERIDTGRNLYAILFGLPEVHQGILQWAKGTPHTGSRSDYWTDFYTSQCPTSIERKYRPRIQGDRLRPGAKPIYSPTLEFAWPDVKNPEPSGGHDWYETPEAAKELYCLKPKKDWNLTKQYCKTMQLVEKAVAAEEWLKGRK